MSFVIPNTKEGIIDFAINPTQTQQEKYSKHSKPKNLDDHLGIGAADSGNPVLNKPIAAGIGSRADTGLDEAAVLRYRGAEGLSPYYR